MLGCDRRLQRVRADLRAPHCAGSEREAIGDLAPIPLRAVLLVEQHQLAVGTGTRGAPRIVEQHQRQQATRLGFSGQKLAQQTAERDGFAAEVGAYQNGPGGGGVALVEDEVDHRHDRIEPRRELRGFRHLVRDTGIADLAFGTHQALRHRRR